MMRKIRNTVMIISGFFCWGVIGSLELERLSLSSAVNYILVAAAICAAVFLAENIIRFSRALIVRFIRRRRSMISKRSAAVKTSSVCTAR